MPTSNASIDTSLLAHAMLPQQRTDSAVRALDDLVAAQATLVGSPALFAEFPSLLRAMTTRGSLSTETADSLHQRFLGLEVAPFLANPSLVLRAWEIATLLNQGDTFDAMGYAVAEAIDGEFWTSDHRFSNAADAAGLDRVRFVA